MTLFSYRQRVQTKTRRARGPSWIRTFCRFGLKRRRVATIEWLREFPNAGPLPQLKQIFAMSDGMVVAQVTGHRSQVTGKRRQLSPISCHLSPVFNSAIRITATAALRP